MTTRLRVASDVGGTFTDSIAYDSRTGRIAVAKVSTTPHNRAEGTVAGLKKAVALLGASGAEVDYVGHGTTTTTNAVIQRTGARTAFLVNDGFRDILLIGRQNRPTLFDLKIVRPEPLVERELCFTARGRLAPGGVELQPLNEDDVRDAARAMAAAGVETVAVLFLHSYANPAHEQRAQAILQEMLPGVPVCISTEINSEFREYERGSTTVLNAWLRPVMDHYLRALSDLLHSGEGLGLAPGKPVMVMDAAGGLMTLDHARAHPVHTVLSGPAGGVVAAAHVAQEAGLPDIITMDIGGTSTDISLIRNGRPAVTRSAVLETVPIRLPVIDINAIGAGGGSIAWIDEGGALRVGPQSAEAVPGPACYGRGGTRPTVTDANLVLGRFSAESRLGGDMALDLAAAEQVIRSQVATPLGLSLEEAAAGILRVAHANIMRGIRVVSVERGHDPRDFALVPFGGAGPMHGSPVARELGMPRVMLPPNPGILCALGQLISELRHEYVQTHVAAHAALSEAEVLALIGSLADRARRALDHDGVPPARQAIEARIDMRYRGQSFELPVPAEVTRPGFWAGMPGLFHALHEARFGYSDPGAAVEVVGLSVIGTGELEKPALPRLPQGDGSPQAALNGRRRIYFEQADAGGAYHDAAVYDRAKLRAGDVIAGPAVIDEISATSILYPGDMMTVHPSGNLIVEVAQ